MNKYIFYIISLFAIFTACNDEFMDRFPQTSITAEGFFNTPEDLKTYAIGLYDDNLLYVRNNYENEPFSDNISHRKIASDEYAMLAGTYSAAVASGWNDWSTLRRINFFLVNAGKATGNQTEINHWIGLVRYFRAVYYIDKIQQYSDVPWYNTPLATNDEEELYKPSDPRTLVADSIVADLEFAVANMKADVGNRTAINKYGAQFLLSRFCLYEGTFRKYHAELNLQNTANAFLEKAATTAEGIINSNVYSITGKGSAGFTALFTSGDLTGNSEIILMGEYTQGLSDGNSSFHHLYGDYALSRSLMESFLMKDGSRFTEQPGYNKKEYKDVFVDRDPRFEATFVPPGFRKPGSSDAYQMSLHLNVGGYEGIKYYPRTKELLGAESWRTCYNDLPIYRYAEVLLSYAEAKAELGTLTQDDLDKTVNKIRARVDMPSLNLASANANIDPILSKQYPNVSGNNTGVILEIRRERRVELALEGQRLQDINRWFVGELLAQAPQGIYIPKLGAYDTTGDGTPDFAILASAGSEGPIADLPDDVKASINKIYLDEQAGTFYLSEGTSGYIMFTSDRDNPRQWVSPKYYYRPIPSYALVLNPNLKQVFGWDN
ncbi:MAG: RagB/SusD family nutrient uptake outer membrane protein [Tannerella sp.]|nr:RagB/SusD family nutrient uptake outer membrane protein [Tannerella sp.]